jgi:uncharacterized protein (TIGR02271 family)
MREIRTGMIIYSADGDKLGKVVRLEPDGFIIEKGFFFPKDYFVRNEDVASVRADDDEATLSLSKATLRPIDEQADVESRPRAAETEPAADEVRVALKEEELVAGKRTRQAGAVRVKKEVITEEKQITVPVTHEEVQVERVPAGGQPADEQFSEQEIAVPLQEEEVVVAKRPVVREEVRVTKRPVTEERVASETVRREEAEIESEGDIRKVPGSDDDKRHL